MNKAGKWIDRHTQQSVVMKVGVLPIVAKTGASTKNGKQGTVSVKGENVFIVGESEVGGSDIVGGN